MEKDDVSDEIYKDLIYTQNIYIAGEQVYPYWESIYALILSGFFIVYFTSGVTKFSKLFLCGLGILFSFNWFRLVSRAYLYSRIRVDRLKELELALHKQINLKTEIEIRLFSLNSIQEEKINQLKDFFSRKSSWLIRKDLPKYILFVWIALLLYTIFMLLKNFFS